MNTLFLQSVSQADGRYLSDQELGILESYVQTYSARSQAYQVLSEKADELVIRALKQLAQTHRQEVQTHSVKCKRDMTYALKYIARAALMDEADAFQQDFALWMENITRALHKGDSSAKAYSCLKAEIQKVMPAHCAALVTPYIDELVTAFSGG